MLNIAYTTSGNQRENLYKIEELRARLAILPLTPKHELRLRWDATIARIYWLLQLTGESLSKQDIHTILTHERLRMKKNEHRAIGYKQAMDHIREYWLGSDKPALIKHMEQLWILIHNELPVKTAQQQFKSIQPMLKELIEYLGPQRENPFIQAAIASSQVLLASPVRVDVMPLALCLSYGFLYKAGYDCRGLLVIGDYWKRNTVALERGLWAISHEGNANAWIEFFIDSVATQLHLALEAAQRTAPTSGDTRDVDLTDRQREILILLEAPQSMLTNKKVQKRFSVSQITASRDLAKLARLGLIFSHGKGRSIYYTKA